MFADVNGNNSRDVRELVDVALTIIPRRISLSIAGNIEKRARRKRGKFKVAATFAKALRGDDEESRTV